MQCICMIYARGYASSLWTELSEFALYFLCFPPLIRLRATWRKVAWTLNVSLWNLPACQFPRKHNQFIAPLSRTNFAKTGRCEENIGQSQGTSRRLLTNKRSTKPSPWLSAMAFSSDCAFFKHHPSPISWTNRDSTICNSAAKPLQQGLWYLIS